jgi:hypothetical protein
VVGGGEGKGTTELRKFVLVGGGGVQENWYEMVFGIVS